MILLKAFETLKLLPGYIAAIILVVIITIILAVGYGILSILCLFRKPKLEYYD